MPREGVEIVLRRTACRDPLATPHPWYVLIELSSQAQMGCARCWKTFWRGVSNRVWSPTLPLPRASNRPGCSGASARISAKRSATTAARSSTMFPCRSPRCRRFLKEAHAAVLRVVPGARSLPFGHLGDGNIHYNVNQPIGADKAEYLTHWNDMNAAVYEVVKQYGRSISAELGIGVVKRHQLASVKDPVALDLMRSMKNLLDPKGF
jgi:FAD/FMN-containing dehydrogenase